MKTIIKSLWKGMIPVRDVFVSRALAKSEDLVVEVGRTAYILTPEQLRHPRMSVPIKDNFSEKMQKLCYYGIVMAKEESKQSKLF